MEIHLVSYKQSHVHHHSLCYLSILIIIISMSLPSLVTSLKSSGNSHSQNDNNDDGNASASLGVTQTPTDSKLKVIPSVTIRRVVEKRIKNPNIYHNSNNMAKKNTSLKVEEGEEEESNYESNRPSPDSGQWNLQFDPSYFASLNAANHRPIGSSSSPSSSFTSASTESPLNNEKAKSTPSTSPPNMYYFTPESYGKNGHKNHQTGSYAYLYPASTSSSTPPTPNTHHSSSNEAYEQQDTLTGTGSSSSDHYSEPALPQTYSMPLNMPERFIKKKRQPSPHQHQSSSNYYNYGMPEMPGVNQHTPMDQFYEANEETVDSKYFYPSYNKNNNNKMKQQNSQHSHLQYSLPPEYYTDLSSSSTSNENAKSQNQQSQPAQSQPQQPHQPQQPQQQETPPGSMPANVEYNTQDVGDYDPGDGYADFKYGNGKGSGNNDMKFPSKYYESGNQDMYYPSQQHFQSPYYPHGSHHGPPGLGLGGLFGDRLGDGNSLFGSKAGSWLGPGIAGLLMGIIPLGILIASMVPAFVSVPVVSTSTIGRRKRDTNWNESGSANMSKVLYSPVLDLIANYGIASLDDSQCLQEMFCSMTVEGGKTDKNITSNVLQKLFYKMAKWAPIEWVKSYGMSDLVTAIQVNKCKETFHCKRKK